MKRPEIRNVLPPLAAAAVAIIGAILLWQGLQRTDALGGDTALTGRLPAVTQPVVVTAPGMPNLSGSQFTVRAWAAGGRGVFVGVGRSDDVEAYLDGAARAEVTAWQPGGTLRITTRAGDSSLPDPAGVDVWADAARGAGTVSLTWPQIPGSWQVVVAVDGRTPPSAVDLTWTGRSGSSTAPALIAIGAVLLVAGLAGLLAIRSGRVFARVSDGGSVAPSRRGPSRTAGDAPHPTPGGAPGRSSSGGAPDRAPGGAPDRTPAEGFVPAVDDAASTSGGGPGRASGSRSAGSPVGGNERPRVGGGGDDETDDDETALIQPFRHRDARPGGDS